MEPQRHVILNATTYLVVALLLSQARAMDSSVRPLSSSGAVASSSGSIGGSSSANTTYYYSLDDTFEGCYRDVANHLSKAYNFKRTNYKKNRSKLEKKRLPIKELPVFIWCINEKDIDFSDLKPFQITNHFECVSKLTTKTGFTDMLRDCVHISENMLEISPRGYNLGDPMHKEDFLADYKVSAAVAVLKIYLFSTHNSRKAAVASSCDKLSSAFSGREGKEATVNSLTALAAFMRVYRHGEWPGVERNFPVPDTPSLFNLSDASWDALLRFHYGLVSIIDTNRIVIDDDPTLTTTERIDSSSTIIKVKYILHQIATMPNTPLSFQSGMGGFRNVWIVKPPETSCGIGIKVFSRLEDILLCEKGIGGRVAQKYVEEPFLVNIANKSNSNSGGGGRLVKFDLRVWVLVLSIDPLVALVFDRIYGRHCASEYECSVESLPDSLMHLTNYSVQRRSAHATSDSCAKVEAATVTGLNAIRKLRGSAGNKKDFLDVDSVDEEVKDGFDGKEAIVTNDTNLLLSHFEVVDFVNKCSNSSGDKDTWRDQIWPKIKEKVVTTLKLSKQHLTHRHLSFELLGYDVILDSQLTPWLLEVNMSPALAHRSEAQSNLIKHMSEQMVDIVLDHKFNNIITSFDGSGGSNGCWELVVNESKSARVNRVPSSSSGTVTINDGSSIINSTKTFVGSTVDSSGASKSSPLRKRPSTASSTSRMHIVRALSTAGAGRAAAPSSEVCVVLDINNLIRYATSSSFTKDATIDCTGEQDTSASPTSSSILISSLHCNANMTGGSAGSMSLHVAGSHLPLHRVAFYDNLIDRYCSVVKVQAFLRKMIANLRSYHYRRRASSITIQASARRWLCSRLAQRKRTYRLAVRIQSGARMLLGRARVRRKREAAKSVVIQKCARAFLARRQLALLRRCSAASVVAAAYRSYRSRKYLWAVKTLIACYKVYSGRRRFYGRIVVKWCRLYCIRRKISRRAIARGVHAHSAERRRRQLVLQKINCKIIANYAMISHEAVSRRRESAALGLEDRLSYYYNKFLKERDVEVQKIAMKIRSELASEPLPSAHGGIGASALTDAGGSVVQEESILDSLDCNLDSVDKFIARNGYLSASELKVLRGARSDGAAKDVKKARSAAASGGTADDMVAYVNTYFEKRNGLLRADIGSAVGSEASPATSCGGAAVSSKGESEASGQDHASSSSISNNGSGIMRYSEESFREMTTLLKYYKSDPEFLKQFVRLEQYQHARGVDGAGCDESPGERAVSSRPPPVAEKKRRKSGGKAAGKTAVSAPHVVVIAAPAPAPAAPKPNPTRRPKSAAKAVRSDEGHTEWLHNVLEELGVDGGAPLHPILQSRLGSRAGNNTTSSSSSAKRASGDRGSGRRSRFQLYASIGRERIASAAASANPSLNLNLNPQDPSAAAYERYTAGGSAHGAAMSGEDRSPATRQQDPWGLSDNIVRSLQSALACNLPLPAPQKKRKKKGGCSGGSGKGGALDSLENYIFDNSNYF